jgi:hypothetical protein
MPCRCGTRVTPGCSAIPNRCRSPVAGATYLSRCPAPRLPVNGCRVHGRPRRRRMVVAPTTPISERHRDGVFAVAIFTAIGADGLEEVHGQGTGRRCAGRRPGRRHRPGEMLQQVQDRELVGGPVGAGGEEGVHVLAKGAQVLGGVEAAGLRHSTACSSPQRRDDLRQPLRRATVQSPPVNPFILLSSALRTARRAVGGRPGRPPATTNGRARPASSEPRETLAVKMKGPSEHTEPFQGSGRGGDRPLVKVTRSP